MIGPIGYDIAVFLNNFHWWQDEHSDIQERLDFAVREFSDAFDLEHRRFETMGFCPDGALSLVDVRRDAGDTIRTTW